MIPFTVLINTDDVDNHRIVVYARENHQAEALEQACRALHIPFNHVIAPTVTPQQKEKVQA